MGHGLGPVNQILFSLWDRMAGTTLRGSGKGQRVEVEDLCKMLSSKPGESLQAVHKDTKINHRGSLYIVGEWQWEGVMSSHFLPNAPYPFLSLSDLLANLFCFVADDLQDERCSPAPQCRILHSNRQRLSQFTAATLPTSACPVLHPPREAETLGCWRRTSRVEEVFPNSPHLGCGVLAVPTWLTPHWNLCTTSVCVYVCVYMCFSLHHLCMCMYICVSITSECVCVCIYAFFSPPLFLLSFSSSILPYSRLSTSISELSSPSDTVLPSAFLHPPLSWWVNPDFLCLGRNLKKS